MNFQKTFCSIFENFENKLVSVVLEEERKSNWNKDNI
jgi:hypothetical protein